MQATVLYDKDTGHVFALATAVAALKAPAADKPEEVAAALRAFAGGALPTRGYLDGAGSGFQKTEFSIPVNRLAVLAAEVEPAVMLSPIRYAVRDEALELSPSDPLPQLAAVNRDGLKVTLSAECLEELPVLLQVVPEPGAAGEAQTVQGVFRPASATKQELTLMLGTPLSNGGHGVLMLIRGFRSGIRRIVLP